MNQNGLLSILNIIVLCIIIASVSVFFVAQTVWVGVMLILLSVLCIASLIPFKIKLASTLPDIAFGLIDNGILAIFAIFGGHFAGVAGAIL